MRIFIFVLCTVFFLNGCEKKEEVRDVSYYQSNPDDRREKIKECRNNPGELSLTPNCLNASEADRLSKFGKTVNSTDYSNIFKSKR
jgi:hypothetical protein